MRGVFIRHRSIILPVILLVLVAAAIVLLSIYLPDGIDWMNTYRPATRALLAGKSPYEEVDIYFAAPWTLIPLIPLALLPVSVGRSILFLCTIAAFGYTAIRLKAKPPATIAFLLSPPVMHCLLNANVEWLPVLGFVLPPQIGLFFISVKPQIGFAVGLFWLVESWRSGGIREVIRVFWPVTTALLLSFIVFGVWPLRWQNTLSLTRSYNASLWPWTIPVGLGLIAASLRTRNIKYAFPASPCLSPYVLFHAWSGALVSLAPHTAEMITTVAGLWILVAIRAFTG